jgi:OmpA-OmpF porin, OOP family
MKKRSMLTVCLLAGFGCIAQSQEHRIGITVGGGSQKYNGDLGNGFQLKNEVWRGSVAVNANYYLNPSFDVGLNGSIGDFGFCQPHDMADKEAALEDRCPGCLARVGLGNLSSRMYMGGALLKYKFSNGYLLREDFRIRPYVYAGVSVNYLQDKMRMNCIVEGNYLVVNSGIGARYYLNERFNVGYNLNIGYFTSDGLDFISRGRSDLFLQNTVFVGIDLF